MHRSVAVVTKEFVIDDSWEDIPHYFDAYSSHRGWHFIVWRNGGDTKTDKQFEIVCHRVTTYPDEITALQKCHEWMLREGVEGRVACCTEIITSLHSTTLALNRTRTRKKRKQTA